RERVTVFEGEHGFLREHRVDDLAARLACAHMIKRHMALASVLVYQRRMPLGEGAALAILSRETNRVPFIRKRAESKRFRSRPVDALTGFDHLPPRVDEAPHGRMNVHVLRNGTDRCAYRSQPGDVDRSGFLAMVVALLAATGDESRPLAVKPIRLA